MIRIQDFKAEIFPLLVSSLRKLFDVREGEEIRAGLMAVYIFLTISTLLIIKPVSYSLFLSEFGAAQLPFVFILVSLSAVAVSLLYTKILTKENLNQIIEKSLRLWIISLFIFWILLNFELERNWTLYIFFIWVAIFAVVSTSQFWILANIVFNAREAKRLFGFIGGGAIAGGIFGGYLTKILAPWIGSENLLLFCIAFIVCCIPITRKVWKEKADQDISVSLLTQKQIVSATNSPIKMIWGSPHLFYLASIVFISVLVAKLVEYQFGAVASMKIDQEDQLTAFFGFWLSNVNIASLLIQLFLTRRVVGIFGVGTSLFFLPISIFVGALAILIYPALWSAILIKLSDGSLKQSINKAGIELLALPIPVDIKNQAKSFIDIFIDSFATGIGGALLVFVTLVLNFSVARISFITILLIILWIFLVTRIKREYIKSIRFRVVQSKLKPVSTQFDLKKESVIGGLIKILKGEDEQKILRILRMLKEIKNDRFIPVLSELMFHPSNKIRLEVLSNLYFYKVDLSQHVIKLIEDPDHKIKIEAFHYLFQHVPPQNRIELMQKYLNHDDYKLYSAALICAARESKDNMSLKEAFKIRERVEKDIKRLRSIENKELTLSIKITCAKVIGVANIPELYPYLHILLSENHPQLLQSAIESAGQSQNPEFIPILIRFLKNKKILKHTYRALSFFVPQIFEKLNYHLKNPYENKNIRLNIPKVLAFLGTQKAVDILLVHIEHSNPEIRHEVIMALYHLKLNNSGLEFNQQRIVKSILSEARDYAQILAVLFKQTSKLKLLTAKSEKENIDAELENARNHLIENLQHRLDKDLERIFRLLGLRYSLEDIYSVYQGIKSSKSDIQVNAIEFLDNVLEIDLKRVIIPLVETAMVGGLVDDTLERFNLKVPSEFECLVMLLTDEDPSLQKDALHLIAKLRDDRYLRYIGQLVNSPDNKIKRMAVRVLQEMDFTI